MEPSDVGAPVPSETRPRRPHDERSVAVFAASASLVLAVAATAFAFDPAVASVSVRLACAAGFVTGPLAASIAFRHGAYGRARLSALTVATTAVAFALAPYADGRHGPWMCSLIVVAMTAAVAQSAMLLDLGRVLLAPDAVGIERASEGDAAT